MLSSPCAISSLRFTPSEQRVRVIFKENSWKPSSTKSSPKKVYRAMYKTKTCGNSTPRLAIDLLQVSQRNQQRSASSTFKIRSQITFKEFYQKAESEMMEVEKKQSEKVRFLKSIQEKYKTDSTYRLNLEMQSILKSKEKAKNVATNDKQAHIEWNDLRFVFSDRDKLWSKLETFDSCETSKKCSYINEKKLEFCIANEEGNNAIAHLKKINQDFKTIEQLGKNPERTPSREMANHRKSNPNFFKKTPAFLRGQIRMKLLKVFRELKHLKISLYDILEHQLFDNTSYLRPKSFQLFNAIKCSDIATVKLLIAKNKYLLYDHDLVGQTPLHLAVRKEMYKISSTLIKANANVNALDATGKTPLMLACMRNNFKIVKVY